jgi:ATP-dependent RNA circularization protein (DNA/RNA ligase family)
VSLKYPRSMHLPFSPGATKDDKRMSDSDLDFLLDSEVIITEKIDGSNVCLTKDEVFARSHGGVPDHKSFDSLKPLHVRLKHDIPDRISVFGEWAYAVHSIKYTILPAHLLIFGVRDDELGIWWSWDDTVKFAEDTLGLPTVPLILRGMFPNKEIFQEIVTDLSMLSSIYGPTREGVVVRHSGEIVSAALGTAGQKLHGLGKWVRKNHVETDIHWKRQTIVVQPTLNFF